MTLARNLARMIGALGQLVTGPEGELLRVRAEQQTQRAREALTQAIDSADRTALAAPVLHENLVEAQQQEVAVTTRQQPIIRRTERLLRVAESRLATARATRQPLRVIQAYERAVARRERAFQRAQRPVVLAQRRRQEAELQHRVGIHTHRRQLRQITQARENLRRSREEAREINRPRARLGHGLHELASHLPDIAQRAAQGAQRGPSGAVGQAAMEGIGAVAKGAAMAFGGPFGPAMTKAVDMLGQFANAGFKAIEALDHYYAQAQGQRLSLADSSPSMNIARRFKQFNDMIEDMVRGEELAGTESIVIEQQQLKRQAGREMSNYANRYKQRQQLIRDMEDTRFDRNLTEMHKRNQERGLGFLTEEMYRHEESFIGDILYQSSRFANRLPWWSIPLFGPVAPPVAAMKLFFGTSETKEDKERRERFEEQAKRDKELETRIKTEGGNALDPTKPGNIFENLRGEKGERTWAEILIRAGKGESWSEQMGRPERFR